MIKRPIPSSGEELPVLGLGTWSTFDVTDKSSMEPLNQVLQIVQNAGCKLIDSSPMYGNSEKVIGDLTSYPKWSNYFFYATKVWITGKQHGIHQMESSFQKMKRTSMDLMQIHNLTDWKTQLRTLRDWKSEGKIRYIGITHYTDSAHEDLESVLNSEDGIDFVQFNYSIFSRNAEKSLLNTAADRGVATLINRPFGKGRDFSAVKNKQLPSWSNEYSIKTWSQFFLLYIISHPAVTVVIPATANPTHASDNFNLLAAEIPDQNFRNKMVAFIQNM
ncbi:MAG: aldo/keto reductase [Ignavibacteriaceae bacterium]|nr:aldo/keto reductase [Ignavibacteriaceae bacterium]